MGVIPEQPGVVVLTGVGLRSMIEPANPFCEHYHATEGARGDQGRGAFSGHPLDPHQKGQLPVRPSGQVQRMANEFQHADGGVGRAYQFTTVTVGWVGDHRLASVGKFCLLEEIDTTATEAAVVQIGRHDLMSVPLQHTRHGTIAATRLPDRAAQGHMAHQGMGDPVRCGIEVEGLPVEA